MSRDQRTWIPIDHLCRKCGGRILECVKGAGPTAGGNPIYRCASCAEVGCGMGPDGICWCGHRHRGQGVRAYRCYPFSVLKDRPEILNLFLEQGHNPKSGQEVGFVSVQRLEKTLERQPKETP